MMIKLNNKYYSDLNSIYDEIILEVNESILSTDLVDLDKLCVDIFFRKFEDYPSIIEEYVPEPKPTAWSVKYDFEGYYNKSGWRFLK